MKEARNFVIQEQNAERIMQHLRRSLLTQGFVEVEPGVFERTDARGFKSQVRKATPIERVKCGKCGRRHLSNKPR